MNLFHQLSLFLHPHRRAAQKARLSARRVPVEEAQSRTVAQFQKSVTPDGSIRFIGVDPQMMGFIGNR